MSRARSDTEWKLTLDMWGDIVTTPGMTPEKWRKLRGIELPRNSVNRYRPGSVYIVATTEGPLRFKVGWAVNAINRLAALQVGSPIKLTLLMDRAGTLGDEREIHKALSAYRLHGEWFDGAAIEEAKRLLGASE
jgi:hypothetical protein